MAKVLVFLAEGFEEIEAVTPIDILRRAGADVCTVGVGGKLIKGAHGIAVEADVAIGDEISDFDMLILPGGMPGTDNLEKNETVISLVKKAYSEGKYIGAICAAPKILGALGMLEGKAATSFPEFQSFLKGAKVTQEPVVFDGNIITAKGAGAAAKFAFALVTALFGEKAAAELSSKMHY